jgi:hypothetical protein
MKTIITLALAVLVNTCIVKAQTTETAANTKMSGVQNNPLYKGNVANTQAAEVKTQNPLYTEGTASGNNPMYEGRAAGTDGQPIGGIVVKGGQNGIAPAAGKTDGNPIGGIIVKGAVVQPQETAISNPIPSIGVVVKHN